MVTIAENFDHDNQIFVFFDRNVQPDSCSQPADERFSCNIAVYKSTYFKHDVQSLTVDVTSIPT